MVDNAVWLNFIRHLRAEQEELRQYLAGFERGTMRVGRRGIDTTQQEMETVRREIRSLQATIDRVIAEQGLNDA